MLAVLSKGEVQLQTTFMCGHKVVTSHHGHAFSTWVLTQGENTMILGSYSFSSLALVWAASVRINNTYPGQKSEAYWPTLPEH